MPVEEGKPAPAFSLPRDTGEAVSLADLRAAPVTISAVDWLLESDERGIVAHAKRDLLARAPPSSSSSTGSSGRSRPESRSASRS